MPNKKTTKEKVGAILFVFLLFLIVGSLFWYINVEDKKKTLALQKKVLEQKIENEKRDFVNNLHFGPQIIDTIKAKSFLTLAITDTNFRKIIAEKNPTLVLPVASISKLMTAIIVLENIDLKTQIKASTDFIGGDGSTFLLETAKIYTAETLLNSMLIASDNDSAQLLAGTIGINNFVSLMNNKAQVLGLSQTNFVNVTGLDPLTGPPIYNASTVTDIANLLWYIKINHPEILKITQLNQYNVCDINNFCKLVLSTNHLIGNADVSLKILGGKTGTTDLALRNLALLMTIQNDTFIINVVLNTPNHFAETLQLINNIKK